VSSPDHKKIDFEDLNLSNDLASSLEPLTEDSTLDSPAVGAEIETPAEAPSTKDGKKAKKKVKNEPSDSAVLKKAAKTKTIGEGTKFDLFVKKLSKANPFTVMLCIALAALFIAVVCCLVELGRYQFHISAKQTAKAPMSAPLDAASVRPSAKANV
jgi:hypothetical protein